MPRGYEPDLELSAPPLGHGLSQTPFKLEPAEEQRKRLAITLTVRRWRSCHHSCFHSCATDELYSLNPMPGPLS